MPRIERVVLEAFEEAGPVQYRNELLARLRARGLSEPLITHALSYSPFIKHPAKGQFARFDATAPALAPRPSHLARRKDAAFLGGGQAVDGRRWMIARFTAGSQRNGMVPMPGAMRSGLLGRWTMVHRGAVVGSLLVTAEACHGLLRLASRCGMRTDDHYRLVFDATALMVEAELLDGSGEVGRDDSVAA